MPGERVEKRWKVGGNVIAKRGRGTGEKIVHRGRLRLRLWFEGLYLGVNGGCRSFFGDMLMQYNFNV